MECVWIENKCPPDLYFPRVEHTDLSQVSAIERFIWSKRPIGKELRIPLEVVRGIGDKAEALWLADRLKEQAPGGHGPPYHTAKRSLTVARKKWRFTEIAESIFQPSLE